MREIIINYEKFNKAVKPFIIKRNGKKVSVIIYKNVADYIFKLEQKIIKLMDITYYQT